MMENSEKFSSAPYRSGPCRLFIASRERNQRCLICAYNRSEHQKWPIDEYRSSKFAQTKPASAVPIHTSYDVRGEYVPKSELYKLFKALPQGVTHELYGNRFKPEEQPTDYSSAPEEACIDFTDFAGRNQPNFVLPELTSSTTSISNSELGRNPRISFDDSATYFQQKLTSATANYWSRQLLGEDGKPQKRPRKINARKLAFSSEKLQSQFARQCDKINLRPLLPLNDQLNLKISRKVLESIQSRDDLPCSSKSIQSLTAGFKASAEGTKQMVVIAVNHGSTETGSSSSKTHHPALYASATDRRTRSPPPNGNRTRFKGNVTFTEDVHEVIGNEGGVEYYADEVYEFNENDLDIIAEEQIARTLFDKETITNTVYNGERNNFKPLPPIKRNLSSDAKTQIAIAKWKDAIKTTGDKSPKSDVRSHIKSFENLTAGQLSLPEKKVFKKPFSSVVTTPSDPATTGPTKLDNNKSNGDRIDVHDKPTTDAHLTTHLTRFADPHQNRNKRFGHLPANVSVVLPNNVSIDTTSNFSEDSLEPEFNKPVVTTKNQSPSPAQDLSDAATSELSSASSICGNNTPVETKPSTQTTATKSPGTLNPVPTRDSIYESITGINNHNNNNSIDSSTKRSSTTSTLSPALEEKLKLLARDLESAKRQAFSGQIMTSIANDQGPSHRPHPIQTGMRSNVTSIQSAPLEQYTNYRSNISKSASASVIGGMQTPDSQTIVSVGDQPLDINVTSQYGTARRQWGMTPGGRAWSKATGQFKGQEGSYQLTSSKNSVGDSYASTGSVEQKDDRGRLKHSKFSSIRKFLKIDRSTSENRFGSIRTRMLPATFNRKMDINNSEPDQAQQSESDFNKNRSKQRTALRPNILFHNADGECYLRQHDSMSRTMVTHIDRSVVVRDTSEVAIVHTSPNASITRSQVEAERSGGYSISCNSSNAQDSITDCFIPREMDPKLLESIFDQANKASKPVPPRRTKKTIVNSAGVTVTQVTPSGSNNSQLLTVNTSIPTEVTTSTSHADVTSGYTQEVVKRNRSNTDQVKNVTFRPECAEVTALRVVTSGQAGGLKLLSAPVLPNVQDKQSPDQHAGRTSSLSNISIDDSNEHYETLTGVHLNTLAYIAVNSPAPQNEWKTSVERDGIRLNDLKQLRWKDFEVATTTPLLVTECTTVYRATIRQTGQAQHAIPVTMFLSPSKYQHPLSLLTNDKQSQTPFMAPVIVELNEQIPSKYLKLTHFEEDSGSESYSEWDEPLTSCRITIMPQYQNLFNIDTFGEWNRSNHSSNIQLLCYERTVCFVMIQLIAALKFLQAQGIEEVGSDLEGFLLLTPKEAEDQADARRESNNTNPPSPQLIILAEHFACLAKSVSDTNNSSNVPQRQISLCQCALAVLCTLLHVDVPISEIINHARQPLPVFRRLTSFSSGFQKVAQSLHEERASSLTLSKSLLEYLYWAKDELCLTSGDHYLSQDLQLRVQAENVIRRWMENERAKTVQNFVKNIVQNDTSNLSERYRIQFLLHTSLRQLYEAHKRLGNDDEIVL